LANKVQLFNGINRVLHRVGLDFRRFPTRDQRVLLQYLKDNQVTDCFDVGANAGQYAKILRSSGFQGNIFSFEPQAAAFNQLKKSARSDACWHPHHMALGNTNGTSVINISKNSVSSSILELNELLLQAVPETAYISREAITMKRLDTFVQEINSTNRIFLKIDAQGFESNILEGAAGCFQQIYALQLELSCVSLYNGEKLFDEMKQIVEAKGFYLSSIESGFIEPRSGRLLQVDAIFVKAL
jgi:FkbM family methyltransferase